MEVTLDHPLLDSGTQLVIGHRGNAMFAPENTLPSIQQAIDAGADAVEIDVHCSADGEVVVIHDATTDRTTDGTGLVEHLTLAQLRRMDAGARFRDVRGATPYRDRGVRIPLLAEVLHSFPGTPFVIELKAPAAQPRVLQIIRELDAARRVVLASFDTAAVRVLRSSGLRTGASQPEILSIFLRAMARLQPGAARFDAVFMPRRYRGIPISLAPVLRAGRLLSVPVHTWVENDPHVARRLWERGVSGVVTDDPGGLVKARTR